MGVAYSVGEVDHLYTFFVQWSPDVYTARRRKRSFLLVNQKKLSVIDSLLRVPDPPPWNIITVRKGKRSPSLCSSPSGSTSEDEDAEDTEKTEETEDTLPVLQQDSHILREHHIGKLAPHLPARVQCSPWQLVYSTEIHGTSLKTLYRNTAEIQQPVLLLIQDTHNQVFGAFSSDSFRVSNYCYGTGETFLFTFSPEFKMFRWTGENSYFVRGFLDSLQLGAGGGPFGLWLDSDLLRGSTFSCNTFHNTPLSSHHDFSVRALEVWSFQ
ncbi:nuclear receptor coactivator 7 isoform 1-T1 [Clarias gariepinus]|uniref:nuclear receptor coactivator 7 isoform X1 n=1 Tax=Clarias gariepinus TaxID=13013 RepID=UPI00234C67E0|nr:nuclear receptor coactivator 7 isoform X1 [Clarias gariepinus]